MNLVQPDVANHRRNVTLSARYRWDVTARLILAFAGGFIWVSTFGAFCAALLAFVGWMPLAQGVHMMTLFGYVAWCAVAMWVFHHGKLSILAFQLLGSALVFYGLFQLVR